ncbi:MAG: sulfotransferase [Pseudomonadota bacterium]
MNTEKLFLSVGAMKAGTTFLYGVLARHPDIYFSPEKELHYFAHTQGLSWRLQRPMMASPLKVYRGIGPDAVLSDDFRRLRLSSVMKRRYAQVKNPKKIRTAVNWYVDRYMSNPIDREWLDRVYEKANGRWCADFSNYNALLSDKGWANVRQHCKQLRVMYVMREPVSRCWSHMKFEMLPAGQRDALLNADVGMAEAFLSGINSSHARYVDVVASLRRNLAPEELHIVRLEDVVDNPLVELPKIIEFLGVSDYDFSAINVSKKANATEDLPIPPSVKELLEKILAPHIDLYNELGAEA